jgi:NOL1/NOP2/sun family putative RNA methylase
MIFPFPRAFEDRMKPALGAEWEKFATAHTQPPPVSIRVNPSKHNLPGADRIPWTTAGQYLNQRPVFTLDPAFHAGAYYVQEASSMFLETVVRQVTDLTQPLRVLDLCAAPGGKSTHLLSLLSQDSLLVANEVIRSRTSVLSENIQKWGNLNVVVTNNDPAHFQRLHGYFDVIVVDAPCSGEGLFRKDPDACQEWSTETAALCAQRQRRILRDCWPALKKNGVLLYCSCTYNPEENEEHLTWLAEQHEIEPLPIKTDPSWGIQQVRKENFYGYRFYPHRLNGEGFFIAAVRKKQDEHTVAIKSKPTLPSPPRASIDLLRTWLTNPGGVIFLRHNDLIIAVPERYAMDIALLQHELNVIIKGVAMATVKRDKFVPEHAAALYGGLQKDAFHKVLMQEQEARAYLRKDTLPVPEGPKGFALAMNEKLTLGWVNLLGNRVNNLYPTSWKIRMGS